MKGRHELRRGMLVFVALALVVSGCASGTQATSDTRTSSSGSESGPPAGGAHGGRAAWSEKVAEGIPLHVEARVLSREVMRNIDDPFWPLKDDPDAVARSGDMWFTVWNLEVVEWLKGISTEEIRVSKVVDRQPYGPDEEPVIGEYEFIEPGGTYIFYLGLDGLAEGFNPYGAGAWEHVEEDLAAHPPYHHWMLGHAGRVEEATFPGAGADEG